jgi:hypothetical protein
MKKLNILMFFILQAYIDIFFNSSKLKASLSEDIQAESEDRINVNHANLRESVSINNIPIELLDAIFTLLDAKELISLESVSRSFLGVVRNVWKMQMIEINLSHSIGNLEKINSFVIDSRPFRYLNISMKNFSKTNLPPEIFDLLAKKTSLKKLDISGNILYKSQLTRLFKLTNLTSLNMSRTIIFDSTADALEGISQLINLKDLQINCNQLNSNSLQHLVPLTNLQHLDISNNFALDDTSALYLGVLKSLETLNISNTTFSTEGVKQLKIKTIIMRRH